MKPSVPAPLQAAAECHPGRLRRSSRDGSSSPPARSHQPPHERVVHDRRWYGRAVQGWVTRAEQLAKDVVATDTTPDDMTLSGKDLVSVFERSPTVAVPRHFPDAGLRLHRLDTQCGSEAGFRAVFYRLKIIDEVRKLLFNLRLLMRFKVPVFTLETVRAVKCRCHSFVGVEVGEKVLSVVEPTKVA